MCCFINKIYGILSTQISNGQYPTQPGNTPLVSGIQRAEETMSYLSIGAYILWNKLYNVVTKPNN